MKRIVTIQDISGVGKCSVTIAQPIISAMGVECAVMPTAVLSTHTMFSGFTFCDLTPEMDKIADHWEREGITFDAIYTGYLGSFEQLDIVGRFIDRFRRDETKVVIDPVMADHGKLYTGFTPAFAEKMAQLCQKADLVLPNLTEASFMLGKPYPTEPLTPDEVEEWLRALCSGTTKTAAITGIGYHSGTTGVAYYDQSTSTLSHYEHIQLPVNFHGTGDLFSSVTVGGMMRGLSTFDALKLAADYTAETIAYTLADPTHHTYGVQFEGTIPSLLQKLQTALA